ncbi:MAG: hypothetical protein GOMPHAMPRED_006239 [Gomphillus americanus]|uniref:Microsomal glutathione S-transferase 3 n=1 Tax=Gomphillus americanus TaxID=1940652 RepID=A0A8H3HZ85_9LECA|nr:MAG: hypothetical protein GOMPHAMPRED_006239 [Gomphillus americanus]
MNSTIALTLPANYTYVLLVAASSTLVSAWHTIAVMKYRKRSKIPYPNTYASHEQAEKSIDAYQFNCAQRAHHNFLEIYPEFLTQLAIAGLTFPELSAGLGAVYLVARVIYATGYTRPVRDGGRGRYNGIIQYVPRAGLAGLSLASVYKLIF